MTGVQTCALPILGGQLYAITDPPGNLRQVVRRVSIVDEQGQSVVLKSLTDNRRPDPRFFTFPDGTAGVLLEATGAFYRLTEIAAGR